MKKTLIILFLMAGLVACEQQFDPAPDSNPQQVLSATDDVAGELVTKTADRIFPAEGIRAIASGPAAMQQGVERLSEQKVDASSLWFEPNAGAIWKEPTTGLTHLLALQLPAVPGSRPVEWASLGTGWQNSESIAMDRENFYVVWNDGVYKISKKVPNNWSLIIPGNGENIMGLMNYSAIIPNNRGAYMTRGGKLYAFTDSGLTSEVFPRNEEVIGNSFWMTSLKHPDGSLSLYFRPSGGVSSGKMVRSNIFTSWTALGNYNFAGGILPLSVTGNPMTNLLYEARTGSLSKIVSINPYTGNVNSFSSMEFSPSWSSLVVNNGYVWIMSNTLHQVMTLGSQKGKSAYSEFGWNGIQMACADPTLVIN
jgi:hypothetical protein